MIAWVSVVKTSVNVITNSPSQDYTHLDDHNLPTCDMTPGFKPFTKISRLKIRQVSSWNKLKNKQRAQQQSVL